LTEQHRKWVSVLGLIQIEKLLGGWAAGAGAPSAEENSNRKKIHRRVSFPATGPLSHEPGIIPRQTHDCAHCQQNMDLHMTELEHQ
jgi:hypothetical protein